jgi:hypothetical protein
MKTLIKITVLAVLAAFAVISCTPEAELSSVDWGAINSKNDVERNTSVSHTKTTASSGTLSIYTAANEVTLAFDPRADVLKSSETTIEAKLKVFLSFHHFTVADDPVGGKADTLGNAIDYSYVRRNGAEVSVKLNKSFVSSDSHVVAKIDGTTYTFANGRKMDNLDRGRTGGAIYDDVYITILVTGATNTPEFFAPGNKGWNLQLRTIGNGQGNGLSSNETDVPIAALNLSTERVDNAIKEAVANQLKSELRVERFVNNSWVNANLASLINYDVANDRFIVTSLSRDDLVPYRVVWSGSAPVTTTADYFGVKQWVKVAGANTGTSQHGYYMGTVYGPVGTPWYSNDTPRRFLTDAPTVRLYSYDSKGKNVVLEVTFNRISYGTPPVTYGLKDLSGDPQLFKNNFKIAYYKNGYGYETANDFTTRTDVTYIGINDFKYLDDSATNPQLGLNKILITLDPAHKIDPNKALYLYLSPEICYNDQLKSGFGSAANWQYDFFRAYPANINFNGVSFPTLTANVWANGSLISGASEDWHSFTVSAGTYYYIWWNDYYGDGTKTALVSVSARYAGSGSWIFNNNYGNSSQQLYANQDGTVEIRVIPYYDYTGTYSIVYNTTGSRPPY